MLKGQGMKRVETNLQMGMLRVRMRPERRRRCGRKEGGGADEVLLHLVVADLLLAEDRAQRAEAEAWEEGGGTDEVLLHLVVADLLLPADRAWRAEVLLLLAAD
jgi:hypothetical protein